MRILVTGASGLLGQALMRKLSEAGFKTFGIYYEEKRYRNLKKVDIRNAKKLLSVAKTFKPDAVIHTAALTNVDLCEKDKKLAYTVNADGTRNVAFIASKFDAKMIYISTDYVFDGERGLYKEEDIPNPINYYGFTKYLGEEIVKSLCSDFIIARTSVLYGYEKENFVLWVVKKLENNEKIKVITDQFNSPTLNEDLAEQLIKLIEKDFKGVIHTAGRERISRYDFALKIAKVFNLDATNIQACLSSELEWLAKRPRDVSLSVNKIKRYKKPLNILEGLRTLRKRWER
jgi:dTDP-4-dehydrorhamnose reductase